MAETTPTQRPLIKRLMISIARWFDSTAGVNPAEKLAPRFELVRSIPFIGLHLMCLGVLWVGVSPVAVGVAAFMYFIRMFAITGFYHRYFSHKTFKTNRFWQFVFAVWGNTATQRGPLWWAAHHRHHHKFSDTEPDHHSPIIHTLYWSHMGWVSSASTYATDEQYVKDWLKFPELRLLNRFETVVPFLTGAAMFVLGWVLNTLWPHLGTSAMQMLIWGYFISTVVLFHGTCTINSLNHLMGRRRYETGDNSRNSLLLAFVTLGEGWHNNHHYYPNTARQGFYWWEIDITYYGLKLLSWLGIIHDLKPVAREVRERNHIDKRAPAGLAPTAVGDQA